jgi:uncharacterized protein (DUF488 family)
MKFYTIGYGGRLPKDLLDLLTRYEIRSIADVRLRPDRSSMGAYGRARTPDRGIERLLADRGIAYYPITELGNLFLDHEDWRPTYRDLLSKSGDLLTVRLIDLPGPLCLLCAERRVADCHRQMIAEHLVRSRGWSVEHIE